MELEVKGLEKSYGTNKVLKGISFVAKPGKAIGLLGRNGAGKTTTIRIIMGVFNADAGQVLVNGKEIDRTALNIGYLPEERGLYPKKVIMDQLVYFGELRGLSSKEGKENAMFWLKRLNMEEYASKKLNVLSKGNQQKIQLITSLIAKPEIVVLDEPFSGLDPVNSMLLENIIKELMAEGKTVIFSSHQMNYIEEFCENIAILNHGEIVKSGDLEEIKRSYDRNKLVVKGQDLLKIKAFIENQLKEHMTHIEETPEGLMVHMNSSDLKSRFFKVLSEAEALDIDQIRVYEPTLNDIFVACTAGSER